jgi:hypothetical protein
MKWSQSNTRTHYLVANVSACELEEAPPTKDSNVNVTSY